MWCRTFVQLAKSCTSSAVPIAYYCLKLLKAQLPSLSYWKRQHMDLVTAMYAFLPVESVQWLSAPTILDAIRHGREAARQRAARGAVASPLTGSLTSPSTTGFSPHPHTTPSSPLPFTQELVLTISDADAARMASPRAAWTRAELRRAIAQHNQALARGCPIELFPQQPAEACDTLSSSRAPPPEASESTDAMRPHRHSSMFMADPPSAGTLSITVGAASAFDAELQGDAATCAAWDALQAVSDLVLPDAVEHRVLHDDNLRQQWLQLLV
ncbi:hypothetical protein EON66_04240 [archaeon]|nr:MAG: hypothetical protein EON66_04240 [archaeon]